MIFRLTRKQRSQVLLDADILVHAFDGAARTHGLQTGRTPLHVRAEIRRSAYEFQARRLILFRLAIIFGGLSTLDYILTKTGTYPSVNGSPPFQPLSLSWLLGADQSWAGWVLISAAYIMLLIEAAGQKVNALLFHDRPTDYNRSIRQPIPALCAALLWETTLALNASIPHRRSAYRRVDQIAQQLIKVLPKVATDRRLTSRGSGRRKALKEHTALVAAAIQRATSKVDVDPSAGLSELAELSFVIAIRCAECRPGALLDSANLSGLTPLRSHETLRLFGAVILTLAAAIGIGFLDAPAAATPLLIGGVGLVCFSAVYGHTNPRSLELLDSVRGIQRP
ncbi:hypothetical protein [Streptomyces sp. DH10]|uniref:hypothetical protein n=1 Tax=Streptomyces sp. DH10 TaxID=3040121 RepID=UPI002441EA81|nr:hypothetical protein [Streptomyces sp. DH10]MDG9708182.1 hypothetical protein [Streptomyces sp. DH10]